eukprot:scpid110154/ scgid24220/ 
MKIARDICMCAVSAMITALLQITRGLTCTRSTRITSEKYTARFVTLYFKIVLQFNSSCFFSLARSQTLKLRAQWTETWSERFSEKHFIAITANNSSYSGSACPE